MSTLATPPVSAPSPADAATTADPRWAAVTARDAAQDGRFVYGVRTTGIYCRPSCPSRTARPRNVAFYATPAEAEAAGLRACLRCRPRGEPLSADTTALVEAACRTLAGADGAPRLLALAEAAGLSRFHFHRLFRAKTGLTPKAFAAACRAGRVRGELAGGGTSVTEAIYAAGYGAPSRFYEAADGVLGMTPTAFSRGGEGTTIRHAAGPCSLGFVLVAQSERGICAILLGDDPAALVRDLERRFPRAALLVGDAGFEAVVARVVALVEAPGRGLDLPLDLRGTAFQERVWGALRNLRPGETVSYAELARRLGEPKSVRAVAGACGANPVAVAVPCHRVVRQDGGMSGYRWGIARKQALLDREADG